MRGRLPVMAALLTGLVAGTSAVGCAGYRGGWESVAYIGAPPDKATLDSIAKIVPRDPPELRLPGLSLRVAINNTLRTYDTKVYLYILPLSFDPRDVYHNAPAPGRTRVLLTVTTTEPGFVFQPTAAVLHVGDRRLTGEAGFEFGQWDEQWRPAGSGGRYDYRPIVAEDSLREVGRRYHLSIDFATTVPSPRSPEIVLDLARALRSAAREPLPLIRFTPGRWKAGYT